MRVLYIGSVKSSEVFLRELIVNQIEIVTIITKKESSFNSDFVDLGGIARENNIEYYYVDDINDESSVNYIREKSPDVIFCFGWSRLLKREILDIPSKGVIGFHPSLLPYNRGRHPLIWALALGLEKTASTFFVMDETADTGKIISQREIEILYDDDATTLYNKVLEIGKKQVIEITDALIQGKDTFAKVHDGVEGNSWRKRGKNDGKIDWRMSSRGIYNLVRALTKPYVGAHFVNDGNEYRVWKLREYLNDVPDNIEPGKILRVFSETHFIIKAGEHAVEIVECDSVKLCEGEYLKE